MKKRPKEENCFLDCLLHMLDKIVDLRILHHSRNDGYVVSPYNIKIPYRNQMVRVNGSINKMLCLSLRYAKSQTDIF